MVSLFTLQLPVNNRPVASTKLTSTSLPVNGYPFGDDQQKDGVVNAFTGIGFTSSEKIEEEMF
ncbi:hypothetical protein [Paenibacillus sp. UASWS1643]|uniref:hypothetical protein n=1 Tax=Paenibacillus sp. UASWS1643 TaxID=2580422 RepID=UPI001689E96B|nr:hypothetical protein [Paenibacillus sp. UASWS1643]